MNGSFSKSVAWPIVWLLASAALPLTGCGPSAAPEATEIATQPAAAAAPQPMPFTAADFQATIYGTYVPAAKVPDLDAGDLTVRAARGEDLQQYLGRFGPTQALHRASQAISLTQGNLIRVGAKVPFVTGARVMPDGKMVRSVKYQNVGAVIRVSAEPAGQPATPGRLRVRLEIELSDMGYSDIEIATGVKATVARRAKFDYTGAIPVDAPFVLLAMDGSSTAQDANAVAYVCRMRLGGLR